MIDDRKAGARTALPESDPARIERDHKEIARLADDLLPALIARLASSCLGEIEVRQGGWRARLRKPAGSDAARKAASRSSSESHAGRVRAAGPGPAPGHVPCAGDEVAAEEPIRIAATSPAVGIYHPRRDLAVGMRVRAGEKIGGVDVLGVNQDVIVPVDGIIGTSLAEAGEAVEYGQELVRIELPERRPDPAAPAAGPDSAAPRGNA